MARLRGQGLAQFREEVAIGITAAAQEMEKANLDSFLILFSIWTEALKHFAEQGKGNVIFLDGSTEGYEKTLKQMMVLNISEANKKK